MADIFLYALGVKILRQIDERASRKPMEQVKDAEELEGGRRQTVMADVVDRLKPYFERRYLVEMFDAER